MRWTLWSIGFFGALACVAATAYLGITDSGLGPIVLAQSGMLVGVALLMLANPRGRR